MEARIVEASFLTSATKMTNCLPPDMSEVAFLGRSNVGKSSLLNAVTKKKALAKTSATPGKTRLINFFAVTFLHDGSKQFARFVDLPGVGYAKVSKEMQQEWQRSLADFLRRRSSIMAFIRLIDARHPELEVDMDTLEFLKSLNKADAPIIDVYTKVDKLGQNELAALKRKHKGSHFVSSQKNIGIDELTEKIFNTLFKVETKEDEHQA